MSEPGTVQWERARAERAEAEILRLRKALEFYARPAAYQGANQRNDGQDSFTPKGSVYILSIERDWGVTALRALDEGYVP